MRKKQCLAMILAGGQGSRLGRLTQNLAKPAVPYGGKYRIIDFALSNCVHAGIDTVGVLTQYKPFHLHTYIGSGAPWGLDRKNGGVYILPPYRSAEAGAWYSGTANAIYQNIAFVERFAPRYVLVLSGDHIYKMHYGKMLDMHMAVGAAATIAVMRVPQREASRFGIMETNDDGRILDFEEKPRVPKSDLASMGVYIFCWDILKRYLLADAERADSQNDFGKNIIPAMLTAGEALYAYPFDGYWRDVGTLQSLWEANMDLIGAPPRFDLYDPDWKIFSREETLSSQFVGSSGKIKASIAASGAEIYGSAEESVLFSGAVLEADAAVYKSVIFPGARVGRGAVVRNAIVDENAVVKPGQVVWGSEEEIFLVCGEKERENDV